MYSLSRFIFILISIYFLQMGQLDSKFNREKLNILLTIFICLLELEVRKSLHLTNKTHNKMVIQVSCCHINSVSCSHCCLCCYCYIPYCFHYCCCITISSLISNYFVVLLATFVLGGQNI